MKAQLALLCAALVASCAQVDSASDIPKVPAKTDPDVQFYKTLRASTGVQYTQERGLYYPLKEPSVHMPPHFPLSAIGRGENTKLMLVIEVNAQGRVDSATVKSFQGGFTREEAQQVADHAKREWRFPPGAARNVIVPIRFSIARMPSSNQ